MKSRYGKLPFKETSYYRIQRKRFLCRVPLLVAHVAATKAQIGIILSSDAPRTDKRIAVIERLTRSTAHMNKMVLSA